MTESLCVDSWPGDQLTKLNGSPLTHSQPLSGSGAPGRCLPPSHGPAQRCEPGREYQYL